jgi:RND family efflux transporter MFP subunit
MDSKASVWLARVCESAPRTRRALLLLLPDSAGSGITVAWPPERGTSRRLANAARTALAQRSVLTEEAPASAEGDAGSLQIAVPLTLPEGYQGAIAIVIEDRKEADAAPFVTLLRSAARWLEPLLEPRGQVSTDALLIDLLAVGLEQSGYPAACTVMTSELATSLDCERVSVGFRKAGQMAVEAISHSARLPKSSGLLQDLGAAMDEACDQDAAVVFPALEGRPGRIVRAHEKLLEQHRAGAVCTVPFAADQAVVGAFSFERPVGAGFSADEVETCEAVAALAGALLQVRREAHEGPLARARKLLAQEWRDRFGPDQLRLKLAAAVLVPLFVLLAVIPATYRVTCDATLEGRVQRAVVAGIDGFVAESAARAGDAVQKGDLLARIDDRDLRLERRKWRGRREQLRQEHREALASHDRAQIQVLSARTAQAEAQLRLLEENLARTALAAPFDGVVIRGDLSQSLGSPVQKGDVLFEVAPSEGYRIILEVDERDVADVVPGQAGRLALSALPGQALSLTVDRVTPVATAAGGSNHYRVEARLDEPLETQLRPGMAGIAKIDIDRRRLLWIWTHPMVDWLRLWAWSWLP